MVQSTGEFHSLAGRRQSHPHHALVAEVSHHHALRPATGHKSGGGGVITRALEAQITDAHAPPFLHLSRAADAHTADVWGKYGFEATAQHFEPYPLPKSKEVAATDFKRAAFGKSSVQRIARCDILVVVFFARWIDSVDVITVGGFKR